MPTAEKGIEIAVPVRTAYNQWTQFEEFPKFMDGVEEVRQLDATHLHWKTRIAGVEREFDAEITEQTPDERIAWHSVGEVKQAGVVTFHRLDDTHTRIMLQLDMEPETLTEKLGDVLGIVEHQCAKDMERFKAFIEARGVETDAWRGEVTPN